MLLGMSAEKLVQVLEERFGVGAAFAEAVRPLLERFAEEERSPAEWEALLRGLSEAHLACRGPAAEGREEVRVLIRELASELRKMEESLKILSVFIGRIRSRIELPRPQLLQ